MKAAHRLVDVDPADVRMSALVGRVGRIVQTQIRVYGLLLEMLENERVDDAKAVVKDEMEALESFAERWVR